MIAVAIQDRVEWSAPRVLGRIFFLHRGIVKAVDEAAQRVTVAADSGETWTFTGPQREALKHATKAGG